MDGTSSGVESVRKRVARESLEGRPKGVEQSIGVAHSEQISSRQDSRRNEKPSSKTPDWRALSAGESGTDARYAQGFEARQGAVACREKVGYSTSSSRTGGRPTETGRAGLERKCLFSHQSVGLSNGVLRARIGACDEQAKNNIRGLSANQAAPPMDPGSGGPANK